MDLDAVLSKVQKLVNKSEHPETDAVEAAALRAKADGLMLKYAIDQAALNSARPEAERAKPESITIEMCEIGSPFEQELSNLAFVISKYTRTKFLMYGYGIRMKARARESLKATGYKFGYVKMKVYGFESDLKYFNLLWTVLNLHLANGLEIDYDFAKSLEYNTYIMHNAGYNWLDIARAFGWAKQDPDDYPGIKEPWRLTVDRPGAAGGPAGTVQPATMVGSRFKRAYYREIGRRGEDRLSIPASGRLNFQLSFMRSYWIRVGQRFDEAARSREPGAAVMLRSAFEEVQRMYDEENPDVKDAKHRTHRHNPEGWKRGHAHANAADIQGTRVGAERRKAVE
jgi:hypothetical protein